MGDLFERGDFEGLGLDFIYSGNNTVKVSV